MKRRRQETLLQIISTMDVETQDELVSILRKKGYDVTQATISRDIKELRLIKTLGENGSYKYAQPETSDNKSLSAMMRIFADSVLSIEGSGNLVVIKTLSGSANAAAEAIDSLKWPEVLGTLAGDNTIFLALKDSVSISDTIKKLKRLC